MASVPATTLAAGIVPVLPEKVPNEAGFSVMALLASEHAKPESTYPVSGTSVSETAEPIVVTLIAVGATGAAVLAAVVAMAAGAEAMLMGVLNEKVEGLLPVSPKVFF